MKNKAFALLLFVLPLLLSCGGGGGGGGTAVTCTPTSSDFFYEVTQNLTCANSASNNLVSSSDFSGAYAFADGGGGGFFADGRNAGFLMQTAEKTFAGYTLTVRNRGGHSSKPRKDNAIYSLAHAVEKIEAYRFEPMLSETTRAYFTERQKQEKGALGDAGAHAAIL